MAKMWRQVVAGAATLVFAVSLAGPQGMPPSAPAAGSENPYTPQFRGDPARSKSEAMALAYLRTVVDAERVYYKKHAKYAPSLQALVGSQSFTRRMVKTERGDYTVSFRGDKEGKKYQLQMIPKQMDHTHRAFWVNEDATIRAEEDKPADDDSPILRQDPQQ
jgi:hypothetical protein